MWLIIEKLMKIKVYKKKSVVGEKIGLKMVWSGDEGMKWEYFGLIVGYWFV